MNAYFEDLLTFKSDGNIDVTASFVTLAKAVRDLQLKQLPRNQFQVKRFYGITHSKKFNIYESNMSRLDALIDSNPEYNATAIINTLLDSALNSIEKFSKPVEVVSTTKIMELKEIE